MTIDHDRDHLITEEPVVRLSLRDWLGILGAMTLQLVVVVGVIWSYTLSIEKRLSVIETRYEALANAVLEIKATIQRNHP